MLKYLVKLLGVATLFVACAAQAQDFPNRPLRIIVAFTPGSGSDTQARLYGRLLEKELGQPVIVENRPGANGLIGLQALKQAPADGYTMGMGGAFLVVNPVVIKDVPYKPSDFRPVAGIVSGPLGLIVGPQSKHKTFTDLLDEAKREKRAINIGTYTATYQMGAAWLSQVSGVPVTNVSYKGAAQILTDLAGGHLEAAVVDFASMKPLLKEGKIRGLAISGDKRAAEFPDVPVIKERYSEYELYVWTSLVVRSDTPAPIWEKLAAAMQRALVSKESQEYIAKSGFSQNRTPPAQMMKYQEDECQRYKRIAESAGIRPE